jgi:hypothetical protein
MGLYDEDCKAKQLFDAMIHDMESSGDSQAMGVAECLSDIATGFDHDGEPTTEDDFLEFMGVCAGEIEAWGKTAGDNLRKLRVQRMNDIEVENAELRRDDYWLLDHGQKVGIMWVTPAEHADLTARGFSLEKAKSHREGR